MISDITIVVPAADEEERISGSLDAIDIARNHLYHRLGGKSPEIMVTTADRPPPATKRAGWAWVPAGSSPQGPGAQLRPDLEVMAAASIRGP